MTITVTLNGKPFCGWSGDETEFAQCEAEVRQALTGSFDYPGATVDDVFCSAVAHRVENGHCITDNPELEKMCVLCFLMGRPTDRPDRPGIFRDYMAVWIFSWDIRSTSDGFEAVMVGGFDMGRA